MTPNVQKQHWLKLSLLPAHSRLFLFPSPQPFAGLHHEPNPETDPIKKKPNPNQKTNNKTIEMGAERQNQLLRPELPLSIFYHQFTVLGYISM